MAIFLRDANTAHLYQFELFSSGFRQIQGIIGTMLKIILKDSFDFWLDFKG